MTYDAGSGEPAAVDLADLSARCTFSSEPADVFCAVSGGADSLALLVLATASGRRVTAIHVDHGLREGSASEAEVVREAAHRYGAAFRPEKVSLTVGPNLEARAREARRSVLPAGTATGHTMDDQAETVVMNLLRGSGLDGLSAMRRGPEHPLLGIRRFETRALCRAEGLVPVEDPSNHDARFVRNRIRHDLLPLSCEIAGRDVVPVLARQAEILFEESQLLEDLASSLDPSDAKALVAAPGALARRATRRWLRTGGYPPDFRAVERVLEVAGGKARATDVAPGRRVRRSRGRLASTHIEKLPRPDVR